MKTGVFEIVNEKECYDNGCNFMLKWVNKMKGEKCRSRLMCRESRRPKIEMNNLDQKMCFHPCHRRKKLKMLVSLMFTRHDDESHVDGPFEI